MKAAIAVCAVLLLAGCGKKKSSASAPRLPARPSAPKPTQTAKPGSPPKPVTKLQLGEVQTAQQQAGWARQYDRSVARARQVLAAARSRRLTPPQAEATGRIQSFLKQAEDARPRDAALAAQLAQRAEVIASDLATQLSIPGK